MGESVVVRFPEEVREQAKLIGAMTGLTWAEMIAEAWREYVATLEGTDDCLTRGGVGSSSTAKPIKDDIEGSEDG